MRSYAPAWGLVALAVVLLLVGYVALAPILFWAGVTWAGAVTLFGSRKRD